MADAGEIKTRGRASKGEKDPYPNQWGKIAEGIAADYLGGLGYIIRERNWRIGHTIEIDIIAQRGDTIVFAEVKARSGDRKEALEAVDDRKMRKMARGADIYLKREPHLMKYRFDIIAVTGEIGNYVLEHIEDAFLPPISTTY